MCCSLPVGALTHGTPAGIAEPWPPGPAMEACIATWYGKADAATAHAAQKERIPEKMRKNAFTAADQSMDIKPAPVLELRPLRRPLSVSAWVCACSARSPCWLGPLPAERRTKRTLLGMRMAG